jgi:hypothetical protein
MRKLLAPAFVCLLFLLSATSVSAESQAASAPSGDFQSVADLVQRVVPWLSSTLIFKSIPSDHGNDIFEIEAVGHGLVIRASSPSSAAMAVNWLLK